MIFAWFTLCEPHSTVKRRLSSKQIPSKILFSNRNFPSFQTLLPLICKYEHFLAFHAFPICWRSFISDKSFFRSNHTKPLEQYSFEEILPIIPPSKLILKQRNRFYIKWIFDFKNDHYYCVTLQCICVTSTAISNAIIRRKNNHH